jgi:hypothetical protein
MFAKAPTRSEIAQAEGSRNQAQGPLSANHRFAQLPPAKYHLPQKANEDIRAIFGVKTI